MTVEVITIGDEILIGQTVDTNSAWLGNRLNLVGIDIVQITSIPDKRDRIIAALDDAQLRADVIIMTGGLGPTQDDITKSTLCDYFETELVRNQDVYDRLRAVFASRDIEFLDKHAQQADLPANAKIITNLNGSASGMWFEKNGKIFISMPGVPYEMKAMMAEQVIPALATSVKTRIIHHTLMTQGMGESKLAQLLTDWENELRAAGLSLAYLPAPGAVRLRITAKGLENGEALVESFAKRAGDYIGKYIYGINEESLEEVLGRALRDKKLTVSTAESCTGGYIAHLITSISGSSDYFLGSVVAYSNEVKMHMLGVMESTLIAHGAVSEEVVKEMAEGVRKNLGTDYAIATSGVAGPTGGTDEKPVGLVCIAVAGPDQTITKQFRFGNNRERNIHISALTGMRMLLNEVK